MENNQINQVNFDRVFKIIHELLQIQDLDVLLECLLTAVKELISTDAGSIYLVDGQNLKFSYTQNNTLQKKLPFGKKLIYSTFSVPINNKSIAGYVASTGIIVNIPDAYYIDSFQPYSFDKHFDETTGYRTRSVLTVPIKNLAGKVMGIIQLINPVNYSDQSIRPFSYTEELTAQFFANSAAIAIEHAQTTRAMIMRINKMLELHDPNKNSQHNNRVAAYSVEIYRILAYKKGVSEKDINRNCDTLRMAAMLYDIGKVAIPTSILIKNRTDLSPEENKTLKSHTIYGANLFFPNPFSVFEEIGSSIALNHHENWDGSGYPGHINIEDSKPLVGYEKQDGTAFGKRGSEIPLFARIVSVAIVYDVLLNSSDIKEKSDKEKVDYSTKIILDGSGKQFDPEVVGAFLDCLDIINSINKRYPN